MKIKKIREIRDTEKGFDGGRLWQILWETEEGNFIVSSASVVQGEPETYLFPADPDGTIKDWLELDGSFKGDLDHERAIRQAGYEIETT